MAPRSHPRNMGWRKPVPRLSPQSSTTSPCPSGLVRRLSLTIINKDMPPLPTDWRETMEHAIKKERRHAVYVSTPPVPPPKDDEVAFEVHSPLESLLTLVDDQEEPTSPVPPPHTDRPLIECVERTEMEPVHAATPAIARRASQKSLPKIYRPPTPPLPAQHPRLLRPVGSSRASSDSQWGTLYNGPTPAEQRDPGTPTPSVLTSWPSRLAPDASVTLHSQESRSHVLTLSRNDLPKARGGASRHARHGSGTPSMSTGNRSSSGRSQFSCHMCYGVWCALKAFGVHLRAKMTHNGKY
ncbi:hypothetical protein C8Q76DRAFT_389807 [Earliella scabrosa]|nr:hypothetical protein C8Q76DRAFT_389807 [Earliella scabrosa]